MQLPKQYPLAVAVTLAMNFQLLSFGAKVGAARKQLFNQQFMNKEFGAIHQKELGEDIKFGGSPDMGSGLYSQKLSYKDWYRFNVAQRNHLNYVEFINFATGSTLAAALYQPRYAAYTGLVYILGRFLYTHFYQKKGGATNKGRMLGAGLCILALLVNTGIFTNGLVHSLRK